MSRSPFQRFIAELRRRHVPQTAAIYLVAAWAAIEFADVVVPNLNGPQWIVTAVIVAALVGFPVMLVVAWVFEWGPAGIHRTPDRAIQRMEAPPAYDEDEGVEAPDRGGTPGPGRSQPWMAALAVLVVGIGSAVAVAYVLSSGDDGQDTGATAGSGDGVPAAPTAPAELDVPGPGFGESIDARIRRAFRAVDSLGPDRVAEIGRQVAAESDRGVFVARPVEWRQWGPGATGAPVTLAAGDTLEVEGVAVDSAGVVRVTVDGRDAAEAEESRPGLTFRALVVGTGSAGNRAVPIVAYTADGRTIERVFSIAQAPGGGP